MVTRGFELATRLPGATAEQVWAHASSWRGVNHELGPFVRMTFPSRFADIGDIPADGESHFTSILLGFGFLPVELHFFALRDVQAGAFFDEWSSNLLLRSWHHRRSITPLADGVEVRDVCRLEPRANLLGGLVERIYAALFRHRHRRLRARFARVARPVG